MPEDRRHIAVMFTDIVGYSAIMGSDENRAFDMLKRNHRIHATLIKKHHGKLIKEVGDGTLASFPLASDAVRCAIEIQKEAKSQEIPLKIGIHQGEMVLVGKDVLGDGVNVASRLQEVSGEGCITISARVYADVKNKIGIDTKFIGDKTLKGVEDPVKVYEVVCEDTHVNLSDSIEQIPYNHNPLNTRRILIVVSSVLVILAILLIWRMIQPEADLPLVVMMDSTHPARVYDKEALEASATNADVISDLLLDLPIRRQKENISPNWHRDEEILSFNPDLIIIHYSGFRQEDSTGPRIRLKLLIEFFVDSSTKFLIYSREEEEYLLQEVNNLLLDLYVQHPDLRSRIHVFGVLDYGKPSLMDPIVTSSLKLRVKQILGFE